MLEVDLLQPVGNEYLQNIYNFEPILDLRVLLEMKPARSTHVVPCIEREQRQDLLGTIRRELVQRQFPSARRLGAIERVHHVLEALVDVHQQFFLLLHFCHELGFLQTRNLLVGRFPDQVRHQGEDVHLAVGRAVTQPRLGRAIGVHTHCRGKVRPLPSPRHNIQPHWFLVLVLVLLFPPLSHQLQQPAVAPRLRTRAIIYQPAQHHPLAHQVIVALPLPFPILKHTINLIVQHFALNHPVALHESQPEGSPALKPSLDQVDVGGGPVP